jgi:ribonuclease HIII
MKVSVQGIVVSLYTSGKVVLQGIDGNSILMVKGQIENVCGNNHQIDTNTILLQNADVIFEPGMIGADEAGKGEYFGPLVTGACFVPKDLAQQLITAGICDSKKITNTNIFKFEKLIQESCVCSVNVVSNKEFNQQIEETGNISEVLAMAHAKCVNALINNLQLTINNNKPTKVLIDKFTKIESRIQNKFKLDIPVVMEEKGEKYLTVACASIIARAGYLHEIEKIEIKYGKLLKGYNGLMGFVSNFREKYGDDAWEEVAKVSYGQGRS